MGISSAELLALADAANPAVGAAIRRAAAVVPVVPADPPAGVGGVVAFRSIDRTGLGRFRSKTEAAYAMRLRNQQALGEVLAWDYERLTVRLDAPDAGRAVHYRPDFAVWHPGGRMSLDEVKGGWIKDGGLLRWRWACEQFPFLWFRLWQYKAARWSLIGEGGGGQDPVGAAGVGIEIQPERA